MNDTVADMASVRAPIPGELVKILGPATPPPIAKLAAALAKAQGRFTHPTKDHTATIRSDKGNYTYSYATLAGVLDVVRIPLAENDLAITQDPTVETDTTTIGDKLYRTTTVTVRTRLMHASGEVLDGPPLSGEARDAGMHAIGSTISYLRRYALLSILGLAADDDDGGEVQAGGDPPEDRTWKGAKQGLDHMAAQPKSSGSDRQIAPEAVKAAVEPAPDNQAPIKTRRQRVLAAWESNGLNAADLRDFLSQLGLPNNPKDLTDEQVSHLEATAIPEHAAVIRAALVSPPDYLIDPEEEVLF